jgi:hypothetical protein
MQRSLRVCKHRGCNNLTRNKYGYCEAHIEGYLKKLEAKKEEYWKNKAKAYDNKRRSSPVWKFYKTKQWVKLRDYILTKYNYIDLYMYYKENRIVMADTCHHIEELRDNWSKRLDEGNMIPVSRESHRIIHELYKEKDGKNKTKVQEELKEFIKRYQNFE